MVGLDQQSSPKQLINEVPSHVVLVNNKVGAGGVGSNSTKWALSCHCLTFAFNSMILILFPQQMQIMLLGN